MDNREHGRHRAPNVTRGIVRMSMSAAVGSPARDYRAPMMIIGLLFFIFGFVTWLN